MTRNERINTVIIPIFCIVWLCYPEKSVIIRLFRVIRVPPMAQNRISLCLLSFRPKTSNFADQHAAEHSTDCPSNN